MMRNNSSTEETGAVGSAEQGVSNLTARKTQSKVGYVVGLGFLLMAALVALVVFGWKLFTSGDEEEVPEKQQQVTTSTLQYTQPVRPHEPAPTPPPAPAPEKPAPKIPDFSAPPQVKPREPLQAEPLQAQPQPQVVTVVQNQPVNALHPKKQEPTLSQRRLASPMMGETERAVGRPETPPQGEIDRPDDSGGKLGELMTGHRLDGTTASRIFNRHLTLPQGTFVNCVMETAVDTTVPGMTSCTIPLNLYSMDGSTILVPRGSRVFGEYRGSVAQGLNRIFLLWTRLMTPEGITIELNSPGTDGLGRAGLTGQIDRHWWERFGNALLFSVIDDGLQFALDKASESNGGVNYYESSESSMETLVQEAMKSSGNIPPTIHIHQGERVGIMVARNLDFSSVYQLKAKDE